MENKLLKYTKKTPNEILNMLNLKEPPFNPFDIANKIGINVLENIDWDKMGHDGEIYLDSHNNPEIWINPTLAPSRKNFTLAHELGHLVNDVLPNLDKFKDPIYDDYSTLKRNGDRNPKEFIANRFASMLLMPKDILQTKGQEIINKYISDKPNEKMKLDVFLKVVSSKFEVSKDALRYRLINIGAIKE